MTVLPGFDDLKIAYSSAQYWGYTVLNWFVLLLYIALTVLVSFNIYKYIIKGKKWKVIPLLFFYIMAFIAIFFRVIVEVLFVQMIVA